NDKVSWDLTVTNVSTFDVFLPLVLVLDPAQGYDGVPQGAGRAPDGRWFIDLSALLPDGQRLHPGETTSGRTLTIYNANDRRVDYTPGAGGAVPANSAPAFETGPALAAEVGQPYSYDAHATDADGEAVYYFLASGPAGMTVDPFTGQVSWTAGPYENVTFHFSDGINEVTRLVTFAIAPADQPPVLVAPADRTLREGDHLRFYLDGYDPDGDPVKFESHLLPPGARLDPNTGLFDWTP